MTDAVSFEKRSMLRFVSLRERFLYSTFFYKYNGALHLCSIAELQSCEIFVEIHSSNVILGAEHRNPIPEIMSV
jgi:hypothetical protein